MNRSHWVKIKTCMPRLVCKLTSAVEIFAVVQILIVTVVRTTMLKRFCSIRNLH